MKYQVIKMHRSEFPDPIVIFKGDSLIIGEKYEGPESWDNWFFCETLSQTRGWVPGQIIKWLQGNEGEAQQNYSAKEMDIEEGDILIGINHLNGWIWCQHPVSEEEGWVPAENLVQI